ncbi:hypothetical protein BpHYR1_005468 [Brachionus plicatilis]|uniref:RNA-directed DNA polymerase from mobile element jockey-like n=1 Tax=Brachionus plicatilis TaxID=10195 RepID=A0A3M7S3A6_BRAPC|nr:hypothetical protein BpHYR1_005468 [Brachionus plicatilis]
MHLKTKYKILSNDYSIRKLQAVQNTATRSILKLHYETSSEILHHLALEKLKLVSEYKLRFESRMIDRPTPIYH